MAEIGRFHTLTVTDIQDRGLYLDDQEGGKLLLPRRQMPEDAAIGDELKVFVYLDSEDRLIATTRRPRAALHQAALMEVADVTSHGAFLNWGLAKDLFVPFAEQEKKMEPGKSYVVYVTLDNTGRLIGSSKLGRYIKDEVTSVWNSGEAPLSQGDKVKLLIASRPDIGYKAIVNDTWWGVLHESQIYKAVRVGQRMEGYVRRIREEDQRLDLSLEPLGHTRADPVAKQILSKLEASSGFLSMGDHSPADLIELHFGISKRAFKMAIGKLFKERKIVITGDGICLPDHPAAAAGKARANSAEGQKQRARTAQPKGSKPVRTAAPARDESTAAKPATKKTRYRNPKTQKHSTLSLKK
ncbi:MAG TPA: GntR family transcriptional regulator [Oceanospirillales bacterium]|nr:GntR family transcriptional regulator [Oceanospirillales bacterium]